MSTGARTKKANRPADEQRVGISFHLDNPRERANYAVYLDRINHRGAFSFLINELLTQFREREGWHPTPDVVRELAARWPVTPPEDDAPAPHPARRPSAPDDQTLQC